MAPPELFINTKTLQLEKQPEIVNVDGYENNQEREDDKKDEEDISDASDPSDGTNGKDESGKAKSPLPILSYILIFTGLAISLAGAFLGINKPAHCYFFVLGLHLLSLGCLHLANAQGIRSFSSLLERWDSCCKQKIASIFIGTVANFIFTALELYTLVGKHFKELRIYRASYSSTTTSTTTTLTAATEETDGCSAMVGLSLSLA